MVTRGRPAFRPYCLALRDYFLEMPKHRREFSRIDARFYFARCFESFSRSDLCAAGRGGEGAARLMQARRLEQARAVGRGHADGEDLAVAEQLDRDLGAGAARGPEAAPQAGEVGDRLAAQRQDRSEEHTSELQSRF